MRNLIIISRRLSGWLVFYLLVLYALNTILAIVILTNFTKTICLFSDFTDQLNLIDVVVRIIYVTFIKCVFRSFSIF